MISRYFTVVGRVQGVGFRWATLEEAQRLGLAGWVQNEDAGSVTGFVQGDEAAVAQFAAWLRQGPRSARVDHVELDNAPANGMRIFTVR